jgi:hypothetical protein
MSATPGAITGADIDEFARTYSRPGGWRGAAGLYQSMLQEGPEIRALAKTPRLTAPVLAVGAGGGPFTAATMSQAAPGKVSSVSLDGVGHYAAMEAPANWRRPFSASPQAPTPPDCPEYCPDQPDSRPIGDAPAWFRVANRQRAPPTPDADRIPPALQHRPAAPRPWPARTGSSSHPAIADQPGRAPDPAKTSPRRTHQRIPDRRTTARVVPSNRRSPP